MQYKQGVRAVVRNVIKPWRYHYEFTGRSDQDLAISSALLPWLKAPSDVFYLSAGLGSLDPAQHLLQQCGHYLTWSTGRGNLHHRHAPRKSSQKDKLACVPQQICSR